VEMSSRPGKDGTVLGVAQVADLAASVDRVSQLASCCVPETDFLVR
jgi:hypothetical protein